jgi:bifunctional ADP-heptose synthase (sugar kinase/adenylyltransferase)
LCEFVARAAAEADALVVLDQVDVPGTGVVTARVLQSIGHVARELPDLLLLADSRRGLRGWPPVMFKMNAAELAALAGSAPMTDMGLVQRTAMNLARQNGRAVIVTMAERGMVGASPDGAVEHVAALPLRGPIDIVGAGDSVTANLAAALAAGATLREALELAITASSIVIHQLGTTGTASVAEMAGLLGQLK